MVAAAVIGAGALAAGATAYAGNQAASATQAGANTAADAQRAALAQQKELAQPYTDLGKSAIDKYKALLGIGPSGSEGIESTLQNLPGYQFQKTEGNDATKAALSAQGLSLSGNAAEALDKFNSGLADSTYSQYLQELQNPVQIGQAAAAGQAANVGQGATNLGNIAVNQGNTLAGIDANTIAGITKAAGNTANSLITNQTLQNLNGGGGVYGPGGAFNTPGLN
jgi:hypothetical protein